ncbi:MAG: efflux RND transporter periplasmic adaptor subunit [Gemmatimonadales bacterium]
MSKRRITLPFPATLPAAAVAALAVLVVFAAGCTSKAPAVAEADAQKPATFRITDDQRKRLTIVTTAKETFRPMLEVTGTVAFDGDRSTQVLSPITGPVTKILVSLGAHVTEGQPLAMVSSPDFANAVAGYRKAEAEARNTQRLIKLNRQLFANDAIARADLDQSITDSTSAAADIEAAISQLRSLGVGEATIAAIREGKQAVPVEGAIVAPITGTVVEKLINPGELMQVAVGATPAFTIADLSTMWVFASVYGADVALVTAGERVDVIVDGALKPIPAHVDYVAPIVDPGTKATSVRILAENRDQLLKRDLFVRMIIHSETATSGILVPAAAVLRDDDNLPFVLIAGADGSFLRRRVTLGHRVGDKYELRTGVTAGEKVVGDGALFIQFAESQ